MRNVLRGEQCSQFCCKVQTPDSTSTSTPYPHPHPSIDITNLHFSGGLSGAILNLLKNALKGTVENELKSQLCTALTQVVKNDVDPLFQKFPYSVAACSVVDGSVSCDLNLGVGRGQVTPFPVPALPEPDAAVLSNHHVEVLLDTYPLNWALWYLFEARIFTFVVDADMIPKAVPIKLNTSFFRCVPAARQAG